MILKLAKRYGLYGSVRLVRDVLLTRLLFRNCRIIRFPCYIRNDGSIVFGENFTSGVGLRLDVFGRGVIVFADNVQVNDYVHIASIENVTIGQDTLIASKVFITDHNHGSFKHSDPMNSPDIPPSMRTLESSSVVIGQRVWLGENVTILPGTIIGDGVVVGANSVVRGVIPENTVIAGVPAKIIKQYNHETKLWEKV